MRLLSLVWVALLVSPATALHAQNPFADVPNEPRPSEYLHWDAGDFAGFQDELEAELRAGGGIWDTDFVVLSALPRAPHRAHDIQIIYRSGYTQPEIHADKWDTYVILDGAGTVLIGGERVGWIDGLPPEEQKPELRGAQQFEVSEGDMVHVPARSWHQVLLGPGESMTYALINVIQ